MLTLRLPASELSRNCSGRFWCLRQEWTAIEGAAQVLEDWQTVLAYGRNITADASVATGADQRAEAAGNLHPYFHHPQGALPFVVGKGQLPLGQEGQDALIVAFQSIQ